MTLIRRVLAAAGVVVLATTLAVGLDRFRLDTGLETFLPEDPSVAALEEKADTFGGDPIVVLLETKQPRDLLLDSRRFERLFALEGRLSRLDGVATVYGPATVLNQIAGTAQAFIAEISGRRDALRFAAEKKARDAGKGDAEVRAAGDRAAEALELRYAKLLVQGLPAGLPTLKNTGFIKTVIFDAAGQPRPRWQFVVPRPDTVALLVRPSGDLDQTSARRLVEDIREEVEVADLGLERITVSGVPAVTAGMAGQVEREAPLLAGLALLLLLIRFALVPSAGRWAGRLLPLLAALLGSAASLATFGLLDQSLSLGAVVLLPLLLSIGSSFPLYLRSVGNRRQVLVTAAASAVAFASLGFSPLPFVRQLGLALALGVAFTVLFSLVLIPRPVGEDERVPRRPLQAGSAGRRPPRLMALGVLVAVAAVGWAALAHVQVAADPRELAQGVQAIDDAEHAESVLGSSGEVNVVLRGPDVVSPEALRWMRTAQGEIVARHGDQMRPVITAPDLLAFLGADPTAEEIRAGVGLVPAYITRAVLDDGRRQSLMTFGVGLQSLAEQDRLLRAVAAALPEPPQGYEAGLVGLPVAAARAYDLVSADRYLPNIAGIVAAGLVLLVGLRRRRDAVLAIAAAALATGWTVGLLALLGVPLTPLSVALGSLTTVTAAEFTALLADAGRRTTASTSRIVLWAALTSAIGYLVLVLSSLTVLREFGLVLVASVLLSYGAARVLLWAVAPPTTAPEPTAAETLPVPNRVPA